MSEQTRSFDLSTYENWKAPSTDYFSSITPHLQTEYVADNHHFPETFDDINYLKDPPEPSITSETKNSIETLPTQDIYDHYDIDGEVTFLINNFSSENENAEKTRQEQSFYIRENLSRFLNEYVTKERFNSIVYSFRNGQLCYGSIPVINMLKNGLEYASPEARERVEAENIGQIKMFEAIEEGYRQHFPNLHHYMQLSPPKEWDYGFVFYNNVEFNSEINDYIVRTHMLRYDEGVEKIDNSQNILRRLDPSLEFTTSEEFLKNPLVDPPGMNDITDLKRIVGIQDEEMGANDLTRAVITKEIGGWIEDYIQQVIELSEQKKSLSEPSYKGKVENLKLLIAAIYNKAQDIKEQIDLSFKSSQKKSVDILSFNYISSIKGSTDEQIVQFAQSRSLKVSGSCPSAKKGSSSSIYLSHEDIIKSITQPKTMEQIMKEKSDYLNDPDLCKCGDPSKPHFHCPGEKKTKVEVNGEEKTIKEPCKHAIIVGKGINECPDCKMKATCA